MDDDTTDDRRPRHTDDDRRSSVLPSDPFDIQLSKLIGLTNGAHTAQRTVQVIDEYGNTTTHVVQTVKTESGEWVFLQQASARDGYRRFILPPRVLALIDRQRHTTQMQVRRRHGKRLAEERGRTNPFTPEMRRKAAETRKRNARERAARRAR